MEEINIFTQFGYNIAYLAGRLIRFIFTTFSNGATFTDTSITSFNMIFVILFLGMSFLTACIIFFKKLRS